MMHNTPTLYAALNDQLVELDKQIVAMKRQLEAQIKVLPYPDEVTVYDMKLRDGSFPLTPLLAARAQVLSGMAALKAADLANRKK